MSVLGNSINLWREGRYLLTSGPQLPTHEAKWLRENPLTGCKGILEPYDDVLELCYLDWTPVGFSRPHTLCSKPHGGVLPQFRNHS